MTGVDVDPPDDPLTTGLADWRTARVDREHARQRREQVAAGERERMWGDSAAPRVRSQSGLLRKFQPTRALLDLVCSGRLIVRVLAEPPGVALCTEPTPVAGNRVHVVVVAGDVPALTVACRCGRTHRFDVPRLASAAVWRRPGRPVRLAVGNYETHPGGAL